MNELEICGKLRPIKFGFAALDEFCTMTGLTIHQVQNLSDHITFGRVVTLLYCGLKYGAKRSGTEFTETWDDVEAWLSDNPELFGTALSMFQQSQAPAPTDKKKAKVK